MKIKTLLLALASLFITTGCGGGSKETNSSANSDHIIQVTQIDIKGDLKGCFEVVDKDYKVKRNNGTWTITVELERTDQELPYDRKDVGIYPEAKKSNKSMLAGFGIEILDEDGDVIAKKTANATPYSWDEMSVAIQLLEGETTTIKYEFHDNISAATGFRITSIMEENENRTKDLISEVSDNWDEDVEDALKAAEKATEVASEMLDVLDSLF